MFYCKTKKSMHYRWFNRTILHLSKFANDFEILIIVFEWWLFKPKPASISIFKKKDFQTEFTEKLKKPLRSWSNKIILPLSYPEDRFEFTRIVFYWWSTLNQNLQRFIFFLNKVDFQTRFILKLNKLQACVIDSLIKQTFLYHILR